MNAFKIPSIRAIKRSCVFGTYYLHHNGPLVIYKLVQLSRTPRSYHTATSKIYENLDHTRNEIRVIKIASGRWDDDISCKLEVVSLDRLLRPRYDTLSYTWGSSKKVKTIKVNRQHIDISTNLFTALRALRHRSKTVTIWADALCIDQKNNSEKSKQVALMGRIYKQGRQTWISLGCPDEKWANASWSPASYLSPTARVLKALVRSLWGILWHHLFLRRSRQSRLGVNHIFDAFRVMRSTDPEEHLDDARQQDQKIATSMLTWLATHEYWTRVWIVQEIALSRKDPICIFGRHQVPLLSLDTVLRDWGDGGLTLATVLSDWVDRGFRFQESRRVGWSSEVGSGVDRSKEICMLRDEFLSVRTLRLTGSMGLLRALQFASYRRATMAHDHVYGLRSLLPVSEQALLQPNYDLSVRELYASVTKLLLRRENSSNLLCAAVGTSQHSENQLPSWSLDFSKPLKLPVRRAGVQGQEDLEHDGSGEFDTLRLQGKFLEDHVTTCAPRDYAFNSLMDNPEIAKFLTRNIYEEDERGSGSYNTDTELDRQSRHTSGFNQRRHATADDVKHASEPSSYLDKEYTVFLTHQGSLGKCTNEVQQGDEIWAIAGSKTAFVLRPVQSDEEGLQSTKKYRLVGPCDLSVQVTDGIDASGQATQSIEII